MRVFNWVHRRFLNVHSDIKEDKGEEKDMRPSKKMYADHQEKHGLLDHDDGDGHHDYHVLNNWNEDGILAIGTLGIGPFDHHDHIHSQFVDDHHDGIFYVTHHNDHDDNDDEELERVGSGCKEIEEVVEDNNENEIITRRRVTLADLFLEDSDHCCDNNNVKEVEDDYDHDQIHDAQDMIVVKDQIKPKKIISRFSKAKKLLKDDFRPLNILNQFMRRIIRKKIHPDVEGKIQKEIQMQSDRRNLVGPHESTPSLLIQDAMA